MVTKNISLPKELEDYLDAKVASGEYAHASEVVRDAIRVLMRQDAEKLEWLRDAIAEGVVSADRGELISSKDIFDEVKRRGRALLKVKRRAK